MGLFRLAVAIRQAKTLTRYLPGIGYEICAALAADGSFHVLMGSRSTDKGNKAIAEIQSASPSASIELCQLDVTSDNSIANAVKQVNATHGRVDVLINNAGVFSTDKDPRAAMREDFETNATSPAMMTSAFAPLLRKSKTPRLIYVSSILGSIGVQSDPKGPAAAVPAQPYRMSKAALNMLVANVSYHHAKDGFKCFAFCPGYVTTDLGGTRKYKEENGGGDARISGQGVLKIASGHRDQEAGKFLHCGLIGTSPTKEADGQYPW